MKHKRTPAAPFRIWQTISKYTLAWAANGLSSVSKVCAVIPVNITHFGPNLVAKNPPPNCMVTDPYDTPARTIPWRSRDQSNSPVCRREIFVLFLVCLLAFFLIDVNQNNSMYHTSSNPLSPSWFPQSTSDSPDRVLRIGFLYQPPKALNNLHYM